MKSAVLTPPNPDFYPLARCCVLKVHWLVSRKDLTLFRRNTSVLTITNERIELS